ncbi:unnamed protein product [Caenorhabditis sp. 36 PRJEB53466]|nr:unnamed protein product [Caenorhabditis sp. 36 PRJEB53466]
MDALPGGVSTFDAEIHAPRIREIKKTIIKWFLVLTVADIPCVLAELHTFLTYIIAQTHLTLSCSPFFVLLPILLFLRLTLILCNYWAIRVVILENRLGVRLTRQSFAFLLKVRTVLLVSGLVIVTPSYFCAHVPIEATVLWVADVIVVTTLMTEVALLVLYGIEARTHPHHHHHRHHHRRAAPVPEVDSGLDRTRVKICDMNDLIDRVKTVCPKLCPTGSFPELEEFCYGKGLSDWHVERMCCPKYQIDGWPV